MKVESLPDDVRNLISRSVRTVGHLDTLIFLATHADRAWTVTELSRELRSTEAFVDQQIRDFTSVVEATKETPIRYQFKRDDENATKLVNQLIETYRLRPRAVIDAIYATPLDAIRSFADAFKFNKE